MKVFRVDPQEKWDEIVDHRFRAVRYKLGGYPHRLLMQIMQEMPHGSGLFRMCFYSSIELAQRSLQTDFSCFDDCKIRSVSKQIIVDSGFAESWDDGFDEGQAFLFWRIETLTAHNHNLSSSGINLNQFTIV